MKTFEEKRDLTALFMRRSAEMHSDLADKISKAPSLVVIDELMDEYERRGDELLEMLD